MNDINKRLCELLGCDVPRPKDTCPLCGKTNTDGKFIDGADFFTEKGRIDLLKRMVARNDYYRFLFSLYDSFEWPAESEYQQVMMQNSILVEYMLDDTGALASAALKFLEGRRPNDP